jgi:hypothetical protein
MVDPSGAISLPLSHFRTLLSNSSNFQSWVGAADATEALNSIYLVAIDEPIASKRPFALVRQTQPGSVRHEAIAGGSVQQFLDSGALEVLFEAAVASGNAASHVDAEMAFTNDIGAFFSDMEALAGSGAYLTMTAWNIAAGPARAHPDESESEGDYYQMLIRVEWGI